MKQTDRTSVEKIHNIDGSGRKSTDGTCRMNTDETYRQIADGTCRMNTDETYRQIAEGTCRMNTDETYRQIADGTCRMTGGGGRGGGCPCQHGSKLCPAAD